jgi:hypothetical protein
MRESRTYGFVRGVLGDWHPYRDSHTTCVDSTGFRFNRKREPAVDWRSIPPKPTALSLRLSQEICITAREESQFCKRHRHAGLAIREGQS